MQDYSTGFVFSLDRKQVVLIRKNRPEWQQGKLNGVGGKAELYESPVSTMHRECYEEADIFLHLSAWNHFATLVSNRARVHFFSTFTIAIQDATTKTDEEVRIYEVADIPVLRTVPNLKWLIPLALMETETLLHPVVFHLESKGCDK